MSLGVPYALKYENFLKFMFFVLKFVKCVYKDDVLFDNQLNITYFGS